MTITLHSRSDCKKHALLTEQMGIVQDCLATSRTATTKLAQALAVIHDEELYLLTHKSFEEFCALEFDLSRSRGYQLLDFAKVVEHISANNCGHLAIPERESHARFLAPLPPAQQIEVARLVRENLDAEGRSTPLAADFENAMRTLGGNPDDSDLQTAETLLSEVDDGDDPPNNNGDVSTPQWLFEYCNKLAIKACGEPLTLDAAAADWNHKCERYFTEAADGLAQDWVAKAIWCNPPYSPTIIEAFVRKALDAAEYGTTTLCLIPSWNYPYLDLCERHGRIHRICNPLVFRRQDGSTTTLNNGFHSSSLVVVVFGPTIRPGCGNPIRKGDTAGADLDADDGIGDPASPPTQQNDGDANTPDLQNTETPPSLCQWIFERIEAASIHPNTILDPCAGRGNLTRPFRPRSQVIEYEISLGRDFFEAKEIACDLVICNPPWKQALNWLQHIIEVVGNRTPIVFLCPVLFFTGYKTSPCRQYLESQEAPGLAHLTPLPGDTFVKVYCPAVILWLNLPEVRNVALVPSRFLIRSNNIDTGGTSP